MKSVHRGLLLLFSVAAFSGCGGGDESAAQAAALVTYLDRETGQTVEAAAQPTPAVNPATGKATLLRAGWCEQCGKWYPIPPEQNPGQVTCPKHKSPLSLSGPSAKEGSGDGVQAASPR